MTLNIWWVYQPKSHRKPNLFQMVQMKRCEWKHYWERSGLRQYLKTSTSGTSYRTERQREEIQSRGPVEIWRSCSAGGRDSMDKHHPGRKRIGKNTQLFHPALWLPESPSSCIQVKASQEETLGDAVQWLASQPQGRAVKGEKWRWGSRDNQQRPPRACDRNNLRLSPRKSDKRMLTKEDCRALTISM